MSQKMSPGERALPGMTLVAGLPTASRSGHLIVSIDELFEQQEPHAVLAYMHDGALEPKSVNWNAISLAIDPADQQRCVYLGEAGQIAVSDHGSITELGQIQTCPDTGPLRAVRMILPDFTVAVGTGLQAYWSRDLRDWHVMPVVSDSADPVWELSLESISSFGLDDMYAVGWGGKIYRNRNMTWQTLDAPTNLDLYRLLCAPDGFVYACGDEGILLRGRENIWTVIQQNVTREKIWDLVFFDGRLYLSTMHLLYELRGDELRQIPSPASGPFPVSTYRLGATRDVLWSIGEKELYELQAGGQWTRLLDLFS